MTAEENLHAQFEALLKNGSLSRSACSGSFLRQLRPLLDSGVVVEERSGAGRRIRVCSQTAAHAFFVQRYPDAIVFDGASNRIIGAARFRNTKALPSDESTLVCVRAWGNNSLFHRDQPVDVTTATAIHGVFAFLLHSQTFYALRGPCALVENPAVFSRLERLTLAARLAIYGQGRTCTRLLEWLAQMTDPEFTLLHLPDYDPIGLSEFARLHARLGERVRLYVPNDLSRRFERFSNRSLLDKPNSRAVLASLRHSPLPEIQRVVELIHNHNAGLEQEALLLDSNSPGIQNAD